MIEIWSCIFSYLDWKNQFASLAFVCKKWHYALLQGYQRYQNLYQVVNCERVHTRECPAEIQASQWFALDEYYILRKQPNNQICRLNPFRSDHHIDETFRLDHTPGWFFVTPHKQIYISLLHQSVIEILHPDPKALKTVAFVLGSHEIIPTNEFLWIFQAPRTVARYNLATFKRECTVQLGFTKTIQDRFHAFQNEWIIIQGQVVYHHPQKRNWRLPPGTIFACFQQYMVCASPCSQERNQYRIALYFLNGVLIWQTFVNVDHKVKRISFFPPQWFMIEDARVVSIYQIQV